MGKVKGDDADGRWLGPDGNDIEQFACVLADQRAHGRDATLFAGFLAQVFADCLFGRTADAGLGGEDRHQTGAIPGSGNAQRFLEGDLLAEVKQTSRCSFGRTERRGRVEQDERGVGNCSGGEMGFGPSAVGEFALMVGRRFGEMAGKGGDERQRFGQGGAAAGKALVGEAEGNSIGVESGIERGEGGEGASFSAAGKVAVGEQFLLFLIFIRRIVALREIGVIEIHGSVGPVLFGHSGVV